MHNYSEKIMARLTKEMNLSEEKAKILLNDILNLDMRLKPIFDQWLDSPNSSADFESHGYTIKGMMEKYKLTFVASILTMDWIIKEPESAIKAIKSQFV